MSNEELLRVLHEGLYDHQFPDHGEQFHGAYSKVVHYYGPLLTQALDKVIAHHIAGGVAQSPEQHTSEVKLPDHDFVSRMTVTLESLNKVQPLVDRVRETVTSQYIRHMWDTVRVDEEQLRDLIDGNQALKDLNESTMAYLLMPKVTGVKGIQALHWILSNVSHLSERKVDQVAQWAYSTDFTQRSIAEAMRRHMLDEMYFPREDDEVFEMRRAMDKLLTEVSPDYIIPNTVTGKYELVTDPVALHLAFIKRYVMTFPMSLYPHQTEPGLKA